MSLGCGVAASDTLVSMIYRPPTAKDKFTTRLMTSSPDHSRREDHQEDPTLPNDGVGTSSEAERETGDMTVAQHGDGKSSSATRLSRGQTPNSQSPLLEPQCLW